MHEPSNCCGADTYICQMCGEIFCGQCQPASWRPDITGHDSAGNVCPSCVRFHEQAMKTSLDIPEPKGKTTKKAIKFFIREKLATDVRWALRALVLLYHRQTSYEQQAEQTKDNNSVGFNGFDAEILTSFAKQYLQRGFLTPKQSVILLKKVPKYWEQILSVCDGSKLQSLITTK